MFGKKTKEIQRLQTKIAELLWEDCKNERGILIDTSGLFYCQDILDKLKGKKAFSWAAKKQLEDFHEDAIHLTRMTRNAIKTGKIESIAFLAKLPESERKNESRRNKILISRAVTGAIARGEIRLPFRIRNRIGRALERKRARGYSEIEVEKERYRQIRIALKRCRQILRIWPLFKERFDTGEWRTVSSDANLYHEVMNSTVEFRIENGDREKKTTDDDIVGIVETEEKTLGEAIGSADSRIIAAALVMQKKFKEVVLVARDKRLREAAESKGIQVASTVEEISRLQN